MLDMTKRMSFPHFSGGNPGHCHSRVLLSGIQACVFLSGFQAGAWEPENTSMKNLEKNPFFVYFPVM
jgi:hypothetical protein